MYQGISDEFIPPILDLETLDTVVDVDDGDAILMAQKKQNGSEILYFDHHVIPRSVSIKTIKEISNSHKNNAKMSIIWILIYIIGSLFSNLRKREYRRRSNFLKKEY